MIHRAARAMAVVTAVAAICSTATAQTPAAARGTTFTIHVANTPVGDGPMAAAMAAQRSDWTGLVAAIGQRGRIDIVDGNQSPVFEKGDYILFDAGDAIVVNPRERSFLRLQVDLDALANGALGMSGLEIAIKNIDVKVDSLGPSDTLAGYATRRYRVSASHEMTIGSTGAGMPAGVMPPMNVTQTSDYWLADAGNVPATPFGRVAPPAVGQQTGPLSEFVKRVAAAMASLPTGRVPVKSVMSVRVNVMGMSAGTDNVTELGDFKSATVDPTGLVLPAGFTERSPLVGMAPADTTKRGSIDKWRSPPQEK